MRFRHLLLLGSFLSLAMATDASAAVECQTTETPVTCITRANREARQARTAARPAATNTLAAEESNELASKPTGVQTGGENLASNTTNFIPLLSLTGLLGDVQQGETEGTYAFDLNFLVPGLSRDKNAKLQAVVNSQPKVSDAVKSQLPEDQRDELAEKLQAGLGDLSDYSLNLTYSWVDRRHGRGFEQYRDRFASLVAAVNRKFDANGGGGDLRPVGRAVESIKLKFGIQGDLLNKSFQDLAAQSPEAAAELKAAVEKSQEEALAKEATDRGIWLAAGLGHFADLLDNQPQLNVTAQQSYREDVVGGDEVSGKVTYEWGRANLNSAFRTKRCHEELDTQATNAIDPTVLDRCLTEYTAFVEKNKAHLKDGEKFSLSAEYMDLKARTFDLPAQGLTGLTLKGANKLIVKVGYGRYFADPTGGTEPVRLDFVGSYEDVSDDPARQDRGVATLTLTRKFGTLSIPLGIVYANHGEFLAETDKKFSAHLGLKFDLGGVSPQP